MLRLYDKEVIFFRRQQPSQPFSQAAFTDASLVNRSPISIPVAKIIVQVDHRNPGFLAPFFQPRNPLGHRPRPLFQKPAFRKFQFVQHIQNEQRLLILHTQNTNCETNASAKMKSRQPENHFAPK